MLENAQANLEPEYSRNIYCQIYIGCRQVVFSFFHETSMTGLASSARR